MLKLKLQYFGHLIRRTDSLEKTLADAQMPGVCEFPKLEGMPRPQYLAGGRFLGPSLLFNAHRKQNRPTPDFWVGKS